MKNKKLFKLKTSIMNGTVTIQSSEIIIVADNIKDIEKLINDAKKKNKDNMIKGWETVEEIDKFEIGIMVNNKIKRIDVTGILKKVIEK